MSTSKPTKTSATMDWYINTEWKNTRKGLHKKVLRLEFEEMSKPHVLSTVVISIKDMCSVNGRQSNYLLEDKLSDEVEMEMGTALYPIDCYLEIFVQTMIVGETAICTIQTKNSPDNIVFAITLHRILKSREIHKLTVKEMYHLALKYKENGVKMFKTYPLFAHDYFVKAAKCLISYKNFEPLTKENDGMDGKDMEDLLLQIHSNLAACLLKQKRYEDVIYHTEFINRSSTTPPDKAVYRRAVAYYNLNECELAQKTIEIIPNYKDQKDFLVLYQKIQNRWKNSNDQYKSMVQKMFSHSI